MLKKIIIFHFIPIVISITVISITIFSFSKTEKQTLIEGIQDTTNRRYANLIEGNQAEINFISSIKNTKQLTIFGSSEFSDSPYCPYNFLPDSLGMQTLGLGHAYHQNLSILCELLAADEYLENSKICIVLSLAWFDAEGTNTSAFLEFVRPNFINRIIQNKNIDMEYQNHIGAYIFNHQNEMEGITNDMETLKDIYLSNSSNSLLKIEAQLRRYLKKIAQQEIKEYHLKLTTFEPKKWAGDFSLLSKELHEKFIVNTTNNNLYVDNEYYTQYLIDENGEERKGSVPDINLINNNELNDFLLLVKYLKSKKVDCSFIIQPLNPYYYSDLQKYNMLIDTLTEVLDENEIPYLNMYVTNKNNYKPGTLKDIMHLGDYGWMKVNSFLENKYYEN